MNEAKVGTEVKKVAGLAEKTAKAMEIVSANTPQLKQDMTAFVAAYETASPHLEKAAAGHGLNFKEDAAALEATQALIAAGKHLAQTAETVIAETKAAEAS